MIRWLKRLDRTHPFRLYGAGIDVIEGRFADAPHGQDAHTPARAMYRFDPDVVEQGTETVGALAQELERTGELYLWWD